MKNDKWKQEIGICDDEWWKVNRKFYFYEQYKYDDMWCSTTTVNMWCDVGRNYENDIQMWTENMHDMWMQNMWMT